MSDNENASSDISDRHVRVDTLIGEVVVRDDRADLEEIESTAERLLDRAEEIHEKHTHRTDGDGVYR